MAKLIISREIRFHSFGVSEWADAQYETPLVLHIKNAKVRIYLEKTDHFHERSGKKLDLMPEGRIEIEFDPAPARLLQGIKSKSKSAEAAGSIYEIYRRAIEMFEGLLHSSANLRYIYWMRVLSESEFFASSPLFGKRVSWFVDGGPSKYFEPRLPARRGINPMFKSGQLLTFQKWKRLQASADDETIPEGELLELYRIRTKANAEDLRTAAVEASIISEALLRDYGVAALKTQGFSASKVKRIRDELTFNNLLNVVLPLSMSKSEFSKISRAVGKVDTLRRLRNDIVHGNLGVKAIDDSVVQEGTEGAIRLVSFLRAKLGR